MKRLGAFFTVVLICISMCSCKAYVSENKTGNSDIPQISKNLYAIEEITPAGMEELQLRVNSLQITDFLHTDKIAMFSEKRFSLSVENIKLLDCNTISFDMVVTGKRGKKLVLPASGLLMYRWLPMNDEFIQDLTVLWGNITINENMVAFANVDTLSVWNTDSMTAVFRQPDISSVTKSDYFFILDIVKSKGGYMLPYFSRDSSGFMEIGVSGKIIDIPLDDKTKKHNIFGGYDFSESLMYNTTARAATKLNCFFTDESENQLIIGHSLYAEYSGSKYQMFDRSKNIMALSSHISSYQMPPYDFDIFAMCYYENGVNYTKDMVFIAEKKVNGAVADIVIFQADVDGAGFGQDTKTGWNTYTHITLSEDFNLINLGCSKTDTVMTIDFNNLTAEVTDTKNMPQMFGVDNSPNSAHMLYRVWNKKDTSLAVRIMSGNCRMDYITDVTGIWGVDWLAGFYTHNYIYVLTETEFKLYEWKGSNDWALRRYISGDYTVNTDTVTYLCNTYA